MNSKKLLLLAAAIVASPSLCRADSLLGVAGAYNLVALGTSAGTGGNIHTTSDVGGRIAAAEAIYGGTTIGASFQSHQPDPNGFAGAYAIVAGNDAGSGAHFNVNGGGNVYAFGSSASNFNLANEGGGTVTTTGASPINFASLRSSLSAETLTLAGLTSNGTLSVSGNNVTLTGTSATLNVFNISSTDFKPNSNINFNIPAGSTVIINVDGQQVNISSSIHFSINGQQVSDSNNDGGKILFNFYDATGLTINTQFDGSILAPFATFNGSSQLGGTVVAAEIDSTGEVHNIEFTGTVPTAPPPAVTPEPATLTLLGTGVLSLAGMFRRRKSA